MHNTFVFDIETVPDVESAKRLHDFKHLSDAEIADALFAMRRAETGGSDFLRYHLQKIVAISIVYRGKDKISVWSLGEIEDTEATLIKRFYAGIEKYTPTLVSWNGGGFDLPVLHYRSLLHGIAAPTYWDLGEKNSQFKYNNYISRYHTRHIDLMDLIAVYQPKAYVPLDEMATLLGFPGKMGMHGGQVWPAFLNGELDAIRNYCETDVLNTYLVYLRFQLIRGHLSDIEQATELELLKNMLNQSGKPHLEAFLNALDRV